MSEPPFPPPAVPPPPEDRPVASGYSSYEAGQTPSASPEAPLAGKPPAEAFAGFWIRFLGALVDGILLGVVSSIIDVAVSGGTAVGVVLGGAYFTYFHATPAGQTVGNRVCGIRIVDSRSGGHLDYVRALLRWLMSYVSGIALLIGYFWMLWDPEKQTWHDKVANSYVVKSTHYPPPAEFGKPAS